MDPALSSQGLRLARARHNAREYVKANARRLAFPALSICVRDAQKFEANGEGLTVSCCLVPRHRTSAFSLTGWGGFPLDPTEAIAVRGALSDPKGKQYIGSVIWRTEPKKARGILLVDLKGCWSDVC